MRTSSFTAWQRAATAPTLPNDEQLASQLTSTLSVSNTARFTALEKSILSIQQLPPSSPREAAAHRLQNKDQIMARYRAMQSAYAQPAHSAHEPLQQLAVKSGSIILRWPGPTGRCSSWQ